MISFSYIACIDLRITIFQIQNIERGRNKCLEKKKKVSFHCPEFLSFEFNREL